MKLLEKKSFFIKNWLAIIIVLAVFSVFIGAQLVKADAKTWEGGTTGTWEQATNWNGSTIPTSADTVLITSSTANITVTLSAAQLANFSSLTIGGDATYTTNLILTGDIGTGTTITIANNGTLTQNNASPQTITGALTILSGGTLTHSANTVITSGVDYKISFSALSLDVQIGGSINADSKGYDGNKGEGTGSFPIGGSYFGGGGGANGGNGGNGGGASPGSGGVAYCSAANPATLGSGGGSGAAGSSGGGLVILNITNTLTINGIVSADGAIGQAGGCVSCFGGGGAGGAVKITANKVEGSPTSFTVNGGNGADGAEYSGGGGAGGTVHIQYTEYTSVTGLNISMNGGTGFQNGGAGVVFTKKADNTNKFLYSINNGISGAETQQTDNSLTVDYLNISSSSIYSVTSTKSLIINESSPFNGINSNIGTLKISSGSLTTPNSFSITSTTLEFWQTANWTNSSTLDLILKASSTLSLGYFTTATPAWDINSLIINNGGIFTHNDNSTAQTHVINFSANAMTIDAGGSINVNGKGYDKNQGTGKGIEGGPSFSGSGGGAHCGNGGNGGGDNPGAGGSSYCNTSNPSTIGSGGGTGSNTLGSSGGGLVILNITNTLTINGNISTNGDNGQGYGNNLHGGGGAGGAVKIIANKVEGSPTSFTVNGGNGDGESNKGGGGGAGAIYIRYTQSTSILEINVSLTGGTGNVAGSIGSFVSELGNTLPSATTPYPQFSTFGTGFVTVTSTITDADNNTITLYVDYSLDGGVTWASSTLSSVTAASGSPTASVGKIQSITNTTGGNLVTFVWDTKTDLVTTENDARIRLVPNDATINGTTRDSADFIIDNVAPAIPTNIVLTPTVSAVTIAWDAMASASSYLVSSTIESVSTTAATTLTFNTGLTANTLYSFQVKAVDAYSNTSTYSNTSSTYTLANTPSPSATADSSSQITISYTGDATNYYVTNATASTNSGWTSSLSYPFTGLTCGTTYSFSVKGRNNNNIETSSATVSKATNSCGGGGVSGPITPPPLPPADEKCTDPLICPDPKENPSLLIKINNGDKYTNNKQVTLYFNTTLTTLFALSDTEDFSGKSFTSIVAEAPYTLSSGDGEKFVYAMFRGPSGGYPAVHDLIILDTTPPTQPLITQVDKGVVNGQMITKPKISGTAEKGAKITIKVTKNGPVASLVIPFSGGTYYTEASPETGYWEYQFPDFFDPALYSILVFATDPAGNKGPQVQTIVNLKGQTLPVEEPQPQPEETPLEPIPDQPQPVEETPTQPTETITETGVIKIDEPESTLETKVEEKITQTLQQSGIRQAWEGVKKIIDNPAVEKANEQFVAPGIALAAAANVAVGFQFGQILAFLRYLFTQPIFLLQLRKRKKWGIVYNSLSKLPLSLATIRAIDVKTNKIVRSQVTDSHGRFLLMMEPGEYRLEVALNNYKGFSEILKQATEDSNFINLYHGENFITTEFKKDVSFAIPLDPIGEIKTNEKILKEKFFNSIKYIVGLSGITTCLISLIISPKPLIAFFFVLHLLCFGLIIKILHTPKSSKIGTVTEFTTTQGLKDVVIRIFDNNYNKLVNTVVSDGKGHYAVLVGPNKYFATYEKTGYQKIQTPVLDFSSEKTNGMGGVINNNQQLKKNIS